MTYHNEAGQHSVDSFSWDLSGSPPPLGAHSNVEARLKEDNSLGHDKIYYTFISEDNVTPGANIHYLPPGISVPEDQRMYVEFKFTFDRPQQDGIFDDNSDPYCEGHTRNV